MFAVTDPDDIDAALSRFYAKLRKGACKVPGERVVGYPGGSEPHTLYWHDDPGLWIILENNEDSNRSWNCFGTVDPRNATKNLDIVCEINFPHEGIDRRIAGVFVTDEDGRIHVTHSGRIGGNKGPAARESLLRHYERLRRCVDVSWPDGTTTRRILVSSLQSANLVRDVHEFVCAVARYKQGDGEPAVTSRDEETIRDRVGFRPEFSSTRAPYAPPELIESSNDHGPLVNALHAALRAVLPAPKYSLGNDRYRDLYITRGAVTVALFEAKPDNELPSLYTAIGQLSYHSAGLDPPPACILVTPDGLPPTHARKLKLLGIEHLAFRVERNCHHFPRLPQLLARLGLSRS